MKKSYTQFDRCNQDVTFATINQDMDEQIAALKSLNIHETNAIGSLFPQSTPFTPRKTEIHLLAQNPVRGTASDILGKCPLQQETTCSLIRRESYPNLNNSYIQQGYTNYWNEFQDPSIHSVNRKYSMDAFRRFDFFGKNNRLSPSYSNPDLSTRRSIDAGTKPKALDYSSLNLSSRPPSPTSRKSSIGRRASSNSMVEDRFLSVCLEDVQDEIYTLCKDQHGCRFLQKKLEEGPSEHRDIIFHQVYPHFVELMTDPFGNYLCQRMLEYCTDHQRILLVQQVSNSILEISLNMHGTRAVQRMIELITSEEQIQATVNALSPIVVALIKDINGNHVIQKCLHKFTSKEKQFIYDAVSKNCTEVATHRHGCCVLQRCIDFSVNYQTKQLVNKIIQDALELVRDPYGNYVVQYVLELGDAQFSDQLIRQFIGKLGDLSVQKYSSNVIEKCIRVAEEDTRYDLIQEMMNPHVLETLMKDSYANYVVQTALDYANESQHQHLAECIRPLLSIIRNTSYCKRIQGKLNRQPTKPFVSGNNALLGYSLSFHPLMASFPTSP
ncbi:armadillo-type protein [Sporodiniella umbellata]|nr:armadillo-type protein [Sporodiniella umbellata]